MKRVALSSIGYLHNSWITLVEFEQLTDDQKACIQSIEPKTRTEIKGGTPVKVEYVKIKLYDKLAAMLTIAKMMGYNAKETVDIISSDDSFKDLSTKELLIRAGSIKKIVEEKG